VIKIANVVFTPISIP